MEKPYFFSWGENYADYIYNEGSTTQFARHVLHFSDKLEHLLQAAVCSVALSSTQCSSTRSLPVLPHSLIPSTFGGLHTVYASCSLPEPCFFTVLTPAAKRKIGSDNPLWLPKLLPLNEHIPLLGVKLIPVIPESNGSSKEFCTPQRAKIANHLGFTEELELPHVRTDVIWPPCSELAGEPA